MRQYSTGNKIIRAIAIVGDFFILNFLLFAFFIYFPDIIPDFFKKETRMMLLTANFSMLVSQYFFHTIIHHRRIKFEDIFTRIIKLSLLHVTLTFVFLRMLCDGGGFFRFMIIFAVAEFSFLLCINLIERRLLRFVRQSGRNTRSVLFVGSDPAILYIYKEFISEPSTGYKVYGYFDNTEIKECPQEIKHLGTIKDLNIHMIDTLHIKQPRPQQDEISPKTDVDISSVDEIFCSLTSNESNEILRIMKFCDHNLIHFYFVEPMLGEFRISLKPERFGDISLYTNHQEPLTNPINKITKRIFDIIVSTLVCLCILPFIPIIAFRIKRQSPGPIFFKQARTGLNGHSFTCHKFRSMHINKEANTTQATEHDPRKFPFGEFMRKTNIDEIPQFYDVLIGNMSLVGPRPHMIYHTETYGRMIDKYMVRHFSKPGITGISQTTGYRGETKELWQMEERIRRDIWYIENWSFWLDLKILFKTIYCLMVFDKKAY